MGGNGYFNAIEFPVDSRVGYVVGDEGILYKTTDAGEHWQGYPTCAGRPLYALCFPTDNNTGYAVGNGGTIIKTDDGGGAIAEPAEPEARRPAPTATIVRDVLNLGVSSLQHSAYRAELLDAAGRKVTELVPGANDVRALAPGVYFVRLVLGTRHPLLPTKVIINE
jgi:photosystem II stability/assembly factor-like uncharacterized protein